MKTQKINRVLKHFLLLGVFVFISMTLNALNISVENAPVTTATRICNAEVGTQVTVPITVTGFSNISAISLTMIYDASKLHYVNFTKNPLLIGTCNVGDKDLLNGFHRLTLSWFKAFAPGVTLDNGTPIANYVFEFISGPATLEWVDMGPSCEYVDPNGNILTDTPTANFYINGTISSSCLNVPTITPDGSTSFCEGGSVDLTANAGSTYKWSTGETTQRITVTTSGSYTVEVTDADGDKETSAATVVTVTPIPTVVSASVTPTEVIGSGQVSFSATASSGSIKWYDALTDGTEVTLLNPTISTTTTYFAEAISSEGCKSSRTAVTATVIPQGTTQLSYRFAYPRIANISTGNDYFEFEVQVKADETGTSFWKGTISLNFNNITLSPNLSNVENWTVIAASDYTTNLSITGSTLNIELSAGNSPTDVSTAFQTLATVRGKITDITGVAGVYFNETNMNSHQFYKLDVSPGYAAYVYPNAYDLLDFKDIYVGRIHAINSATLPTPSLKMKSALISNWTQVVSLDWNTAVNTSVWDGNATIPGDQLANMSNLRIHDPATLTIPSNGLLTVSGLTEINSANGLVIESDETGTGSFITGSSSGAGKAVVQRYMKTDAWHIVSSPLMGQSISNFLLTNNAIATSEDEEVRGMMDYNSDLNDWNDYFTNSTTGDLETGKGFTLRTNSNTEVSFNGFLQTGDLSTNCISEEWNCVGNPYTSAIAINSANSSSANFLDENIDNLAPSYGAIYVWDQPDANNGVWGIYTVVSNATARFAVQQGQAYMVKLKSGVSSVRFNSDMQFHDPYLQLKSTITWPTIELIASGNGIKSSATIAFNEGMTKGLDPTYDAGMLKGASDLILYSRLVEDNGVPFAVQALPLSEFDNMIIPIGLDFKTGGNVTFTSEMLSLPIGSRVILEDKSNNTFTDLSLNSYQTTVAANSSVSDRFVLHTSIITNGIDLETISKELTVKAIRNTNLIVDGNVGNQASLSLYDILGRLILSKKLDAGSQNTINLPSIKSGIYLLSIKDNGKVKGFKIPISE